MSNALLWFVHTNLICLGIIYAQTSYPPGTSTQYKQLTACQVEVGTKKENVINLEPLARKDGLPRFVTTYNFSNHPWNYSFNPCEDYSVPRDNPHTGFGDGCHSVSVCKYTLEYNRYNYYTLGIHTNAKFRVSVDDKNNTTVELVYKAIKSMRSRITIIKLVCNESRSGLEDGLFRITSDTGRGPLYAELHHQCCCPGACWPGDGVHPVLTGLGTNDATAEDPNSPAGASTSSKDKKDDGGMLLVIIGSLVAILMIVALIGGLCYIKRNNLQVYSKLPGKPSSAQGIGLKMKSDFRDYEPSGLTSKKILPVLEDTMIHFEALKMCQRLGGGIFGDSHLAKWSDMTVAVKRLTLLVHENQITPEAMKLMKNEVWFLSRQRHKNIVSILGLCLDGKLPSIIAEYVVGECLKDFLKTQGRLLSWSHRVRICAQVADGMAFLHSTKPPIIHRDLRCGNLFLLDNDVIKHFKNSGPMQQHRYTKAQAQDMILNNSVPNVPFADSESEEEFPQLVDAAFDVLSVKVADFGLIKMLQPVREECPQDDCCCRRTMSACPASIRWTAPELLSDPVAKERLVPLAQDRKDSRSDKPATGSDTSGAASVITPACDVYSFAMVMWELPMCQDPFEEIKAESEVLEIMKNGGRPETPPLAAMMPQYKELMKHCWDQIPANRPAFKQIAARLKDMGSQAQSYQKQLQNQQRMRKLQEDKLPV